MNGPSTTRICRYLDARLKKYINKFESTQQRAITVYLQHKKYHVTAKRRSLYILMQMKTLFQCSS